MKHILQGARDFGPYLLVELLLPGGSLIALLMWLVRRHPKRGDHDVQNPQNLAASRAASDVGADDADRLCRGACA
ncbi:MAG TPA: hypothetical protein VGJ74_00350 [Burkholderiales bacterium]|jgi:hypothetical protein